jgi:hypothetical protein
MLSCEHQKFIEKQSFADATRRNKFRKFDVSMYQQSLNIGSAFCAQYTQQRSEGWKESARGRIWNIPSHVRPERLKFGVRLSQSAMLFSDIGRFHSMSRC